MNPKSLITAGVEVKVETFYQPEYSQPHLGEFLFAYRITLMNHNPFPVKLLRRQWFIFDSGYQNKMVEGEGVVGVQPLLDPGEAYQYTSGCNLNTEIGKMTGYFFFLNLNLNEEFRVNIPSFDLIAPFKLN